MDVVDIARIIAVSAVIMAVSWILAQLINRAVRRGAKYARLRPEVIHSVTRGITVIFLLMGLVGILTYTGLASLWALVAGLGVIGIVVSLALQATLSNMIAGIVLLMDRTIRLGDLIEISGIKGKVVKIGIRSTWIKTETGDLVIVPNSTMTNVPLKNHSLSARLYKGTEEKADVQNSA